MEDQLTYRSEEVIVGIQRMEEETQQEPTQTHPERNRDGHTSNTMQCTTSSWWCTKNLFFLPFGVLTQSDTTANSQSKENALLNQLTRWKYTEKCCNNPQCTPVWIQMATEWSLLDQNFGTKVESRVQTKSIMQGLWEDHFCVLKPVSACINNMSRLFVEMDNYGNQGEAPGQRERLIRQISWQIYWHTLLRDPHCYTHNHKHPLYY